MSTLLSTTQRQFAMHIPVSDTYYPLADQTPLLHGDPALRAGVSLKWADTAVQLLRVARSATLK